MEFAVDFFLFSLFGDSKMSAADNHSRVSLYDTSPTTKINILDLSLAQAVNIHS